MIWLWFSAVVMVLTALLHSIFGERRLIVPLLAVDSEITRRLHVQRLIRLCWHLISVQMILSAVVVVWPGTPRALIGITGGIWVFAGIADLVATRGKHIGWPPLSAAGLFALLGAIA